MRTYIYKKKLHVNWTIKKKEEREREREKERCIHTRMGRGQIECFPFLSLDDGFCRLQRSQMTMSRYVTVNSGVTQRRGKKKNRENDMYPSLWLHFASLRSLLRVCHFSNAFLLKAFRFVWILSLSLSLLSLFGLMSYSLKTVNQPLIHVGINIFHEGNFLYWKKILRGVPSHLCFIASLISRGMCCDARPFLSVFRN